MFPAKRKMSDCVWSIVVCDFCEISFSCLVFSFFFLQVVRLWIKHRWGVRMRSRLRLKRRKVTKWVCVCGGGGAAVVLCFIELSGVIARCSQTLPPTPLWCPSTRAAPLSSWRGRCGSSQKYRPVPRQWWGCPSCRENLEERRARTKRCWSRGWYRSFQVSLMLDDAEFKPEAQF